MSLIRRSALLVPYALALALAILSLAALAHEKGVLKLANPRLVPGDGVRLAGEKFAKRAELAIVLVGVQARTQLARVRTDVAGAFIQILRVPAELAPGAYRLVAIAADGDEVAALDVEVRGAAPPTGEHTGHDGGRVPSAEPLALARAHSPWVTGGALAIIVVAVLAGGALLRRPAAD